MPVTTVRVNPDTMMIEATASQGPGRSGALTVTNHDVLIRKPSPFLVRLDPADGSIREEVTEDVPSGGDVLVAFGALWTTAFDDRTLFRIPMTTDQ